MATYSSRAYDDGRSCPAVGYQSATVCVPVTVTPYAGVGTTVTKCCGSPVVTAGAGVCDGKKNGACVFTISQDICVAVPVEFGASAEVGDAYITCNGASSEDICVDCADATNYRCVDAASYRCQDRI